MLRIRGEKILKYSRECTDEARNEPKLGALGGDWWTVAASLVARIPALGNQGGLRGKVSGPHTRYHFPSSKNITYTHKGSFPCFLRPLSGLRLRNTQTWHIERERERERERVNSAFYLRHSSAAFHSFASFAGFAAFAVLPDPKPFKKFYMRTRPNTLLLAVQIYDVTRIEDMLSAFYIRAYLQPQAALKFHDLFKYSYSSVNFKNIHPLWNFFFFETI